MALDVSVDADLAIRADPTRWPTQRDKLPGLRDRIDRAPGLTCRTLKFFIDGIIEREDAAAQIAEKYLRFVQVYREAAREHATA